MIVWAEIQSTYLADFLSAIPVFLPHGNVHKFITPGTDAMCASGTVLRSLVAF